MNILRPAFLLSLTVLAGGCQTFDSDRHDEDAAEPFGASVHNMIQSQIYDPLTAKGAVKDTAPVLDGEKAADAMKTYRTDKAKIDAKSDSPLFVPAQVLDR